MSLPLAKAPDRPDEWMTDPVLHEVKIAPAEAIYHFSLEWRGTWLDLEEKTEKWVDK